MAVSPCQEAHCAAEHCANSQRRDSENTGSAPGNKLAWALLKNTFFFWMVALLSGHKKW